MTCPNCGNEWLRPARCDEPPHRTYRCWRCGYGFRTVELVEEEAKRQAFQAALFRATVNGNGTKNGLRD